MEITRELDSLTIQELIDLISVLIAKSSESRNLMNKSAVDSTLRMADTTRSQAGEITQAAWAQFWGALAGASVQLAASGFSLSKAATSSKMMEKAITTRNEGLQNLKAQSGIGNPTPPVGDRTRAASSPNLAAGNQNAAVNNPSSGSMPSAADIKAKYKADVKAANDVAAVATILSPVGGAFNTLSQNGFNIWASSCQATQRTLEAQGQSIQAMRDTSHGTAQEFDKTLVNLLGMVSTVSNLQTTLGHSFRV